jgi:phage tail sheath protein FI
MAQAQMKTPGVYLVEKDAFPNSVVEVATAVPAFIGFTEKAENGGKSLLNTPFRISSFSEYMLYFGGAPEYRFSVSATDSAPAVPNADDAKPDEADADAPKPDEAPKAGVDPNIPQITIKGKKYKLERQGTVYRLYDAMKFFFQNGGGACYIVSVGDYKATITSDLLVGPSSGLITLEKEQEPTMVVIPDALSLSRETCYAAYTQVLAHCQKMMSRIGIFDIYNGYKAPKDSTEVGGLIDTFRTLIGANALNYGAVYYPWVNTSLIQDTDVSFFKNLAPASLTLLQTLILEESNVPAAAPETGTESTKVVDIRKYAGVLVKYAVTPATLAPGDPSQEDLHKALVTLSPMYNSLLKEIQYQLNIQPPAAAMAGVYTMVDNTRGVWKAPANVSLNNTVSPSVNITFDEQEDLNVPLNGKAINAIRTFVGEGILVWGARTLDGNSQDWKYINVRRTMIMLEQSVKAAAKAYVFEPNDANTWITVKSMIDNFLYQQWKKGALVGSKSTDAYSVLVGLGNTMTGDDILNGIMRITVLVAISRPAEFIEITFQQQMQKS